MRGGVRWGGARWDEMHVHTRTRSLTDNRPLLGGMPHTRVGTWAVVGSVQGGTQIHLLIQPLSVGVFVLGGGQGGEEGAGGAECGLGEEARG